MFTNVTQNNFRRTIREVVYVVKVADSTITARLHEYKRTQSAALTVKQFREFGPRLKVKAQPPAIWKRAEKEERREKRRLRLLGGDDAETLEQSGNSGEEAGSTAPRPKKKRRSNNGSSQAVASQPSLSGTQATETSSVGVDALDGNNETVVESVAAAAEEVEAGEVSDPDFIMPKKRGRPPKKRAPIIIPDEDLEIEEDLEAEITDTIKDWEGIFKDFATNENHDLLKRTGWTAAEMARVAFDTRDAPPVDDSPDIGEHEFADDPDVATCILRPEEVRRKEAIWITENEDWLRTQQEKMLQAELELAEDKPKKAKQKRKHHQMGDGSLLEGQPATSAADGVHKMLKKRAKAFSNHINYDKLKELFPGGKSPTDSAQGASPASANQTSPPVVEVTEEDAEGEDDDEEEVAEDEEEEDLENQYMDDDDEGFGNDYSDNWQ